MLENYSLGEIATFLNAELRGDPETRISGLNTLQNAGSNELAFLANEKYVSQLANSSAAAIIISAKHSAADSYCGALLILDNPYLGYAQISKWFDTAPQALARVHPTAVIDKAAVVGANVDIGPNVVVEANVVIGANCYLGAGS